MSFSNYELVSISITVIVAILSFSKFCIIVFSYWYMPESRLSEFRKFLKLDKEKKANKIKKLKLWKIVDIVRRDPKYWKL